MQRSSSPRKRVSSTTRKVRPELKPWHLLVGLGVAGLALLILPELLWPEVESISINFGTELLGAVLTFLLLNLYLPRVIGAGGSREDGFSYSVYAGNIRKSKKEVRILTTFIYPLTSHEEYQDEKEDLVQAIQHVRKEHADIRIEILVLNPESEAAKQRAEERKDDDIILRIQENLSEFHRLREERYYREAFGGIEIRLYDRLPPLALFQWDDRASISNYPRHKKISEAPRFEFSIKTPLGKFMEQTFHDIWTDDKTKSLDDYIFLNLQIEHPGAGPTLTRRAHFVENGSHGFYVLLNVNRDEDTLALLSSNVPGLRVGIARDKEVVPCTCSAFELSGHVRQLATKKYGSFPYQSVVELCVESAH